MAALEVWLWLGHDGGPGVEARAPERLGFGTWAPCEAALLDKLPVKLAEYRDWRARHGAPLESFEDGFEVAGRVEGHEVLLPAEHEPATVAEIELTAKLLEATRRDLLAVLRRAPDGALDWDPPYAEFAEWADWRTIRANLAHVANSETHYYLRNVGYEPASPAADPQGDWQSFLPAARAHTVACLDDLARSADRARVRSVDAGFGVEPWSVRKALGRLVGHEILHTKSIARIVATYAQR